MAVAAPGQLNLDESPSWGSRSVDCFEKLEQIGEGTYGQVFMAKEMQTQEIVALKKIRMDNEREGFPITAIREIKILKKLHHPNVIQLKEIVTSPVEGNKYKGSIYMVFEYMDHDLTGLADRPGMRFTIPQIKCYMRQLLMGLHYCHINQVLHRDIKGSNLLIDNEGILKLADFGLARSFSNDHNGHLTNRVITLWYRPPELLLGSTKYGPAVDMWSVGCIFAELLAGKPILPGKNEPEQLTKIFELCGTPDELNWPGVTKMPWYNNFKPSRPIKRRVKESFKHFDRHALDLLEKMLTLDPSQRISAKDALDASTFGLIPFQQILKACQSMSHHMNFRLRKSVSSSDKLKKRPSDRKHSILNHIRVCHQSSNLANRMHKTGQVSLQWQLEAIIMQSHVAREGQTGTRRVGAKVEDTKIAEDKVVAMAVALILLLSKAEALIHTLVERWVEQVVVAPGVGLAMGLEEQTIRMLVLMVPLVRPEDRTITNKLALATSSSMETGNSTPS
ncbi:hypothetical protein PR202_gb01140 [Eleusine coracana subsp. coracana]|uniref:Protein kinase domain-containing protein n=1 Tax=Eleusine coracana subsp. coracana TaxID=191504 RepID=A0AAV5DVQ2_ELECO|nr:hypothetical protein PR202_gb01140 [Eleusine coracana subsp. coracana]